MCHAILPLRYEERASRVLYATDPDHLHNSYLIIKASLAAQQDEDPSWENILDLPAKSATLLFKPQI